MARAQDPEREVCLPRYLYVFGDPADEYGRQVIEVSVPLAAGDFVHRRPADGSAEVRRRFREIEFREASLRGLGELYMPCVVFDPVD